jgi:uncharacterized delta-60 repeat protein
VHEDVVLNPLDVPLIVQDAPGTPDITFGIGGKVVLPVGPGGVGPGGLQRLPTGLFVVCGHAKTDTVPSAIVISRILPNGDLDPKFNQGAGFALGNSPGSKTDACAAVFLRPNGGIVFTGFATPQADQPHVMLTGRYRPDGFPDQNFGPPSPGGFGTTTFDGTRSEGNFVSGPTPTDFFVVGGYGRGRPALLRFDKNGALDPKFNTQSAQELSAQGGIAWLAQQTTGNYLAAIESSTLFVARFSADGVLDRSFGDDGTKSIPAGGQASSASVVLATSDDAALVLGTQTASPDAADIVLARLTNAGQLDQAFATGGIGTVHFAGASKVSSAIEQDGAIVVAGQTPIDTGPAFTVLRVSRDGTLDTTFGTGGREVLGPGMAQALVSDELGRIVVAGFSGGASEGSLVVYRLWP